MDIKKPNDVDVQNEVLIDNNVLDNLINENKNLKSKNQDLITNPPKQKNKKWKIFTGVATGLAAAATAACIVLLTTKQCSSSSVVWYQPVIIEHDHIKVTLKQFTTNQDFVFSYSCDENYVIDETLSKISIGSTEYELKEFQFNKTSISITKEQIENNNEIIIELFAKEARYHTVTFELAQGQHGTISGLKEISVLTNTAWIDFNHPNYTAENGYFFAGWYLNDSLIQWDYKITSDITVYGYFEKAHEIDLDKCLQLHANKNSSVTFEATSETPSDFTNLYYSINGTYFYHWNYNKSISLNENETLYVLGINEAFYHNQNIYCCFDTTGDISVGGKLLGLVDGGGQYDYWKTWDESENPLSESYPDSVFRGLFAGVKNKGGVLDLNEGITSLSADFFPKIILTDWCSGLFTNCPNLSQLPDELFPNSKLIGPRCAMNMFSNCTGLSSISKNLLKNNLITSQACYHSMFSGCSNLKNVCDLPATQTYAANFYGSSICKNITESDPLLPVDCLAPGAYSNMFANCSSLEEIPNKLLPSTMVWNNRTKNYNPTYSGMFSGCSSLKTIPEDLFPQETFLANLGLVNLTDSAPVSSAVENMFSNCTGLTGLPQNLLKYCDYSWVAASFDPETGTFVKENTNIQIGFPNMFANCSSLEEIPQGFIPHHETVSEDELIYTVGNYQNMFSGCSSLKTIPEDLLKDKYYVAHNVPGTNEVKTSINFGGMFASCSALETIPDTLLTFPQSPDGYDQPLSSDCFSGMFANCTGLVSLPSSLLPATNLADSCYQEMFSGCTSLASLPATLLPAENLMDNCYSEMFGNCSAIETIPKNFLSATQLSNGCYRGMFENCDNLKSICDLPATTLASSCYHSMFSGCSKINITEDSGITLFLDLSNIEELPEYACDEMFDNIEVLARHKYYFNVV